MRSGFGAICAWQAGDIEASTSLWRAGQSKYGAPETAAIFRHMSAFKNI